MNGDPRIPGDQSFFRIGEVARIATVSCSKLRFWEKRFGALQPARGGTGQRRYTREDVKLILFVKDRAERGFGLGAIDAQLQSGALGAQSDLSVEDGKLDLLRQRADRIADRLARMSERLSR